jgi:hypothetical protein
VKILAMVAFVVLLGAACSNAQQTVDAPVATDGQQTLDPGTSTGGASDALRSTVEDVVLQAWDGELGPWYRHLSCEDDVSRRDLSIESVVMFNSLAEWNGVNYADIRVADIEVRDVANGRGRARVIFEQVAGGPPPESDWRPWTLADGSWLLDCSADDSYSIWLFEGVD